MKYLISIITLFIFFAACSEKLSEQQYYSQAKETYNKQKFDSTLINYQAIVENYPNGEFLSEALFMIGFINANDLKDFESELDKLSEIYKKNKDKYNAATLRKMIEKEASANINFSSVAMIDGNLCLVYKARIPMSLYIPDPHAPPGPPID